MSFSYPIPPPFPFVKKVSTPRATHTATRSRELSLVLVSTLVYDTHSLKIQRSSKLLLKGRLEAAATFALVRDPLDRFANTPCFFKFFVFFLLLVSSSFSFVSSLFSLSFFLRLLFTIALWQASGWRELIAYERGGAPPLASVCRHTRISRFSREDAVSPSGSRVSGETLCAGIRRFQN